MKKTLNILAASVVIGALILSTESIARGFGGVSSNGDQSVKLRPHAPDSGQRLLRLTRALDLSDEQIAAIKDIQDGKQQQIEALKQSIKQAREAIATLVHADTYQENEAAVQAAKIGDLVTKLILLKSKCKFDVLQILTPEQQARQEEMQNAFGPRQLDPVDGIQ